jgi:hypothetical protein
MLTVYLVANAPYSQGSNVPPPAYSRSTGFKSCFENMISRMRLSFFFSGPPGKFSKYYLKVGGDSFIPHNFQFIVQELTYHSTLYNLSPWFSNFSGVTVEIQKIFRAHTMLYVNSLRRNKGGPLLLTYGTEPFSRSSQLCSHSKNSQNFMKP